VIYKFDMNSIEIGGLKLKSLIYLKADL
jgi:hypothetical protein